MDGHTPAWQFIVDLLDEVGDDQDPCDFDDFQHCIQVARELISGIGRGRHFGLVPDETKSQFKALDLPHLGGTSPERHLANALAFAIDEVMHLWFTEQWLAYHSDEFELAPGDWYPIPRQRAMNDLQPTSFPESLGVRPGETAHARRFDGPVRVTINCSFADYVDDVVGSLERAATLTPPRSDGPRVVPIADLVAAAFADDATIVVAPELAVPEADLDELWVRVPPGALLVPGTQWRTVDGTRVNRVLLGFGCELAVQSQFYKLSFHDKFAPFVVNGITEEIAPRNPHITVLVGNRYRALALICKDALSFDVLSTVVRLGVSLLVIPAHSEKVDGFIAASSLLASHAQAVTVCANGNSAGDGIGGIVGRPARGQTVATHTSFDEPGYTVWMLDRPWSKEDAPYNPRIKHM